jgi:hypothetical protein
MLEFDTSTENGGPRPRWDRAEHWYPRAGGHQGGSWERRAWKKPLCVNPITWRRDAVPAPRESHRGAVVVELAERPARIKMLGNEPLGLRAAALSAPQPGMVSARCGDDGYLYISEPTDPELRRMVMPGGNYHNYDMALFYLDIRHNVEERLGAWLERRAR